MYFFFFFFLLLLEQTSNYAMPLIKGTILHDSFETALGSNDFSTEALSATIQEKISTKLADIYAVGETDITAKKNLEVRTSRFSAKSLTRHALVASPFTLCQPSWCFSLGFVQVAIPNMQNWAQRFLHAQPKVRFPHNQCAAKGLNAAPVFFDVQLIACCVRDQTEIKFMNGRQKVCVSKVLAIEENIWSPAYGLKGNNVLALLSWPPIASADKCVSSLTAMAPRENRCLGGDESGPLGQVRAPRPAAGAEDREAVAVQHWPSSPGHPLHPLDVRPIRYVPTSRSVEVLEDVRLMVEVLTVRDLSKIRISARGCSTTSSRET
jgi:hypothetical protein